MVCNCDEFLVATKVQMIKLKYDNDPVPDDLLPFLKEPEKYSKIEFPENKMIEKWQKYAGEKTTRYGTKLEATMADGTLRVFQTFYICERCAKVYWDGGHYHNNCGGKLDFIFDLFPEADNN
jgi:Mut7-C RNAse domain